MRTLILFSHTHILENTDSANELYVIYVQMWERLFLSHSNKYEIT